MGFIAKFMDCKNKCHMMLAASSKEICIFCDTQTGTKTHGTPSIVCFYRGEPDGIKSVEHKVNLAHFRL